MAPREADKNGEDPGAALFDDYAGQYNAVLDKALARTGESGEYYARARVVWLRKRLNKLGIAPSSIVDYGCGTGGSEPFLLEILHPGRILGLDVSAESIRKARDQHRESALEFALISDCSARAEFDLAFCNGVFHHILPEARPAALRYVYDLLRPGGIFAFWENNPWNPGTRYVMQGCEFDRDAIMISPPHAKALLRGAGFEVLQTSSCFYFPRWLKGLRALEPALARFPLGGQYLVICRKST